MSKKKTRSDKESPKPSTTTRGATPRPSPRDAGPRSKRSIPTATPHPPVEVSEIPKASWRPGLTIPVEDDWLSTPEEAAEHSIVVKPPPLPTIDEKRASPPPLPKPRGGPPPLPATKRSARRPPRTS